MIVTGLLLILAGPTEALAHGAPDRWTYGEASNYCIAFFRQSPTQLVIRFAAKTGDDTLQVWRKGLPSLAPGMTKSEQEAAASRFYDLELIVAGRAIPLTSRTGTLDPKYVPGPAYVLGVKEPKFIEALASGPTVEVRHLGKSLAHYRIANHVTLARRLAACVAAQ